MSGPSQKKEAPTLAQTMEKYSQYEGATPREKLKNAYAQLSAKASSFQGIEASVTPSSTEDIEPSVPASVPEMAPPLSVRVDKDHSFHQPEPAMNPPSPEPLEEPGQQPTPQTIQPSALTVNHSDEVSPGSVHLGSSEFAVPLPMDSRVKDDYERALLAETQGIREFLKGHTTPETLSELEHGRLVVKIREVLNSLSNVATHPDLRIADHIKSMDSDLSKEADWAQYSSAKFLFLGYLVEIAGNQDVHLVIMVSGEKTQNVVERYLLGKGLVYSRPREEMGPGTNLEISLVKGPLSFGIQTTSNEGVTETYKSPSAIIALDPSLNVKSPSVEHMRTTFARNGSLLPVIRLIVSNSSEHIELCFPKAQELLRLQLTMQYTVRFRDMVGELQDDALGVREDAEEILSWLLSDRFNKNWPLAPIEPLQLTSTDELLSTQLEAPTPETVSSTASSNSHAQKRLLTDDSGEHSSKRLRVELSQDNTQLTESTKFPSQTLDSGLHALETNLMQMQTAHAAEIEKFQKTLDEMRTRLQERDQQLESLQHRYETRTKEVHKFRRERDQLANSKTTSEQKMEKQREEINKLKNERTQLRHELEQSRAELKSEGGKMAELETAREEIRRLTKEKTGLERKAEYEAKQAEYTREQYQNASNTAAQTGNEVRQLREDNQSLTRKVEGNALRLREINMKSDEDRHLLRIAELESTLAMREDLLRRKEDELREIRKNRPSTRSTSTQPRSPRLTAGSRPTSPGINNHNGRGSALRYSSEMPA
ncbi:class II histone deacetylase complex subunits 2 and 3-domain-containing protein [Aspergillus avenaceus]|uniref:Class II histone deacetylase complex subunits 2 and 3-domain-containing protein n=1 Tax=Aspergillus avenaceus TaxID=36643 RepID=A0A5N6TVH5_ASPAV|nr:class II histone deacetylase complex subunits 2 and 3-domain-containing protein [Aspergillus avenaceus]